MALTLFAVNNGYFDDIDVKKALAAEALDARLRQEQVRRAGRPHRDDEGPVRRRREGARTKRSRTGRRTALTEPLRHAAQVATDMPGTKEIRVKIKSVQNTRKITKAMEMVAASKMRKAQERMRARAPVRARRSATSPRTSATPTRSTAIRSWCERDTVKRVGIIVITTDKGLCGGAEHQRAAPGAEPVQGVAGEGRGDRVCCIGNKGFGFMQRLGAQHRLAGRPARRPAAARKLIGAGQGHARRLHRGPLRRGAHRSTRASSTP